MHTLRLTLVNLALLIGLRFGASAPSSPDLLIASGEVGHRRCATTEDPASGSQVGAAEVAVACIAPVHSTPPSPSATESPTSSLTRTPTATLTPPTRRGAIEVH